QLAVLENHMPDILDATEVSYTHQFSLAELKDIHAFAETPSGARYMSRATEVLGDPAVAKANTALIADAEALSSTMLPEFKEKLLTYVKAHPDVAAKFADAYKSK